jgi:hypothetical protein
MASVEALKRTAIAAAIFPLAGRMRRRSPFQALFADAARMQGGRLEPERFREQLDDFYANAKHERLLDEIEFEENKTKLQGPHSYKVNVHRLKGDPTPGTLAHRLSPWARRFGLFRRIGIRSDIIILREGEQIPPHAHERVISGFYVAEGRVHLRHYHRDRTDGGQVYLRLAIDQVCDPGGYGTNSDKYQNVHWVEGLAPASYLLRFTVTGVPSALGLGIPTDDRIYVDPTGKADDSGVIRGRVVTEELARKLKMAVERAAITNAL